MHADYQAGRVTLTFDGDGRRLKKQGPSQTTRFIFDFEKVLQEADGAGTVEKEFVSTEEQYGDLVSAYGGGGTSHFGHEAPGSTDALLAPDGSVQALYSYRAFGLSTHVSSVGPNRYTWVGKQGYQEDTEYGLYFLRARSYDPESARFLSKDPDGFGAGDANLFRYANNDPVNNTDPSGKRVLVPEADFTTWELDPCNSRLLPYPHVPLRAIRTFTRSPLADVLAGQIERDTGFTPITGNRRLHLRLGVEGVRGYDYGVVDLFGGLPAAFWAKARVRARAGPGSVSALILSSLERDYAISAGGGGSLTWGDPPASWSHALAPAGKLLWDAVRQAGADVWRIAVKPVAGVAAKATLVGLAAMLQQAKALYPELDADAFVEILDRFGEDAPELLERIIAEAKAVGDALVAGVGKGASDFFTPAERFANNLGDAFFGWLFGEWPGEDGVEVPEGDGPPEGAARGDDWFPEPWSVVTGLLQVLGLTPEGVLDILREVKEGGAVAGVLLAGFELLQAAAEGGWEGLVDLLEGKAAELIEGSPLAKLFGGGEGGGAEALNTSTLITEMLKGAALEVGAGAVRALATEAAVAAVVGWVPLVGQAATGAWQVYKALDVVFRVAGSLKRLGGRVARAGKAVIAKDVPGIALAVRNGLQDGVGLALTFVQARLRLGDIPTMLRDTLAKVKKWLHDQIRKLMEALVRLAKRVGLGLGGAGGEPLTKKVEGTDKKAKAKAWLAKKGGEVVVMVESSPAEDLGARVMRAKTSADPVAKEAAIKGEGKLKAAVTRGEKWAKPVTEGQKLDRPASKGGKQVGKKAGKGGKGAGTQSDKGGQLKDRKELQKELPALADLGAKLCGPCCRKDGKGGKTPGTGPMSKCIAGGTLPTLKTGDVVGPVHIRVPRVGLRVPGEGLAPERDFDRDALRLVRLSVDHGDGNGTEAVLLRDAEWLGVSAAFVGGLMWLYLPEQGIEGWATLRSVEDCPELEPGPGHLVTGWFAHTSGQVCDLQVEGEPEVIGITGAHPVWSLDRQDWVSVLGLREGEWLSTRDGGAARVLSVTLRPGREPVYNIEVDGQHCYRVGEQGILVHNASTPCTPPGGSYNPLPMETVMFGTGAAMRSVRRAKGVVAYITPSSLPPRGMRFSNFNSGNRSPEWWKEFRDMNPPPLTQWERGHLLGSSLGGPGGSSWENMVPLYQYPNGTIFADCEKLVRMMVETCNICVRYRATASYTGDSLKPNFITLTVASDDNAWVLRARITNVDTKMGRRPQCTYAPLPPCPPCPTTTVPPPPPASP